MEKTRGFEIVSDYRKKSSGGKLPLRGTKTSAGYDFYATEDLIIKPGEKAFFWTDVKAYMKENEALIIDIRSSKGIKDDLMISNTIPLIDSDYYGNEKNDGNIGISIRNLKPSIKIDGKHTIFAVGKGLTRIPNVVDLTEKNTVVIMKGERIAQGVFIEYKESDNCNSEQKRESGIGSTN